MNIDEYVKVLKSHGKFLYESHGLDVSYVEIPEDCEYILSWYDKDRKSLTSVIVSEEEEGIEVQVCIVRNGRRVQGSTISTLDELELILSQDVLR